jgi:hypothetical protein
MQTGTQTAALPGKEIWTGRVMSGLAAAFLLLDGLMKLARPAPVVEATVHQLGFPSGTILVMGMLLLISTTVYMMPRTAMLGAILLTAYLGGAVAAQVRVGDPLFRETLFPVYIAALVWGGLYLRERRLRTLVPIRK